MLFSENINLFN